MVLEVAGCKGSRQYMEVRMAYHMYRDVQGYWRWRLRAVNGRNIADSGEGYHHRQDCRAAIELVKGSAPVPVYEQ